MKNLLLFAFVLFAFSACTKQDQVDGQCDHPYCNYTTIVVSMEHHGKMITNGSVHIRKNVTDKPDKYDASAKIKIDGNFATARFPELEPGKFYIYAEGFDEDIQQTVTGGKAVVIQQGYEFIEYRTTIAVAEGNHSGGGVN